MKKSRHENLKSAVSSYLKRRNYTPSEVTFRRSEFSRGISLREMVQEEELRAALSQENVVCFNSVGPELSALDSQLARFKTWLNSLPLEISKELGLLVPVALAHMYIEAVSSGANRVGALKFLKRHYSPTLQPDELIEEMIATGICPELLAKPRGVSRSVKTGKYPSKGSSSVFCKMIPSKGIINKNLFTKESNQAWSPVEFWVAKYDVGPFTEGSNISVIGQILPGKLTYTPFCIPHRSGRNLIHASRRSLTVLQHYLSRCDHAHLLQVIGQWVHFVTPGSGALEELEDAAGLGGKSIIEPMDAIPAKLSTVSAPDDESEESEIEALKAAIKDVEDGPLTPSPIRIFYIMNCKDNPISCGALGSNSTLLGSGLETGAVEVWSLTQDCLSTGLSTQKMYGHTAPVRAVSWIGSKAIVSGSVDNDIRLWTSDNFNCAAVYKGHTGSVYSLAVSPLNTYFASASADLSLKLWSPEFTYPLRAYCAHTQPPLALDFHPNGHYLASGSRDCTVRLWASSEGRLVRLFSGHRGGIRCLAFSPDGKSLASAGFEPVVRIWDLAQGSCRLELPASPKGTTHLTWTNDCGCLAAATPDGAIIMWDLTREPTVLTTYTTRMQGVLAMHFSAHNLTCSGTLP